MKTPYLAFASLLIAGCSTQQTYIQPNHNARVPQSVIVNQSKDVFWPLAVARLGSEFFIINNLDKDSGLINVSYSGEPTRFVDCGIIDLKTDVPNPTATTRFPGAAPLANYTMFNGGFVFFVNRTMSLDGRANIIIQQAGANSSRITVNTRYAVTRGMRVRAGNGETDSESETVAFGSNSIGTFKGGRLGRHLECRATGELERQVLDSIRGAM